MSRKFKPALNYINMRRLFIIVILTIGSLVSFFCSYSETDIVNYQGYYDQERKHIKLSGKIIDSSEVGEWLFYDENGEIVQRGEYYEGLLVGDWYYNFKDLEHNLIWRKQDYYALSFSVPDLFMLDPQNSDSLTYTAIDTITSMVFSIRNINLKDVNYEIETVYDQNLIDFGKDYFVNNSTSTLVQCEGFDYYVDEFHLEHLSTNRKLIMLMIYKKMEANLTLLTITSKTEDLPKSRFIIGEVFYHCKVNKKRLADPLKTINNLVQR